MGQAELARLLELRRTVSFETRDPDAALLNLFRAGYVERRPTARIVAGGRYSITPAGDAALGRAVVAFLNGGS